MVQQGKNLKDMDLVSLKALCYDLLAQREQNAQQIQAVNQVIGEKLKEPKEETKDVVEEIKE